MFHLIFCLNFIGQSIREFCLSLGETQVCACILSLLRKRDNRDLEKKKKAVFAILGVGGLATYRVSVSEMLSHNDVSIPQGSATIKEEQTETL